MSSYPPPPGYGDGPSYPPPPGGQPPWGPGVPGGVPADNRATWALTISIVSVVLACCCGVFSMIGGTIAIVLAQQVRNQPATYGPRPDVSTATAAFWIGVAAVAAGTLSLISNIAFGVLDTMW